MPRTPQKKRPACFSAYGPPHEIAIGLTTLLNKSNFVHLAINLKAELALRIGYLRLTILVIRFVHSINKKVNDLTLGVVRLASTNLRLLGLGGFFNLRHILVALLCQIACNSDCITNLITTSLPEDLSRNNHRLRGSVLVSERILDVSRVH